MSIASRLIAGFSFAIAGLYFDGSFR